MTDAHPASHPAPSSYVLAAPRHPHYVRVLSIAGFDSGGAKIQADLKTFSALGCYGMTAITAITAQNTQGVRAIHGIPAAMLGAQIDAVMQDIGVDAVKIGMLSTPDAVRVVADSIRRYGVTQVVLDPVMVATSGDRLIAEETAQALVQALFPLASLITPNLDEAGWLDPANPQHHRGHAGCGAAAAGNGAANVLVKGGHLPGNEVVDVLLLQDGSTRQLASPRIATHNGHGTGCTLSSAIAAYLAQGVALPEW